MSEKAKCRGNPQTLCEVMILWSSLRCSVAIEVELSTFRLKPPFVRDLYIAIKPRPED